MRILLTRPAESAARTRERLASHGHAVIALPLFRLNRRRWTPPPGGLDALLLTSAAAARFAGSGIARYRHLPCYCIGARTADAARAAALQTLQTPPVTDIDALLAAMAGDGVRRALHLAGRDVTAAHVPAPMTLVRRTVYAADAVRWNEAETAAAAAADMAFVYSARGGAALAAAMTGIAARPRLAAISVAAAAAAGDGWPQVIVARQPNEDALFAAAGLVCDKRPDGQNGARTS